MREHAINIYRNPSKAREIRAEVARGIEIPEWGSQFSDPIAKIRYQMLVQKMPNVFKFPYPTDEEIVVSSTEKGRHEIPLLRAMGYDVRFADTETGEAGITFGGHNLEMLPVSESDLGVLIVMLGGEASPGNQGQYLLHNMTMKVSNGTVLFNRVMESRWSHVLYGGNVVKLDPLQSAFLVIVMAKAMAPSRKGSSYNTKFRNAVMACAELCGTGETAYLDPRSNRVIKSRVGKVNVMIGLNGPCLAPNQDPVELFATLSRSVPIMGGPQGETDIELDAVVELEGEDVYVRTSNKTKYRKRLLLAEQAQMHLVDGYDESVMLYKGDAKHGREFTYLLTPSLPALATGGDGSVLSMKSSDYMGKKTAFYVDAEITGAAYQIGKTETQRVYSTLPKVGETMPAVINCAGMVVPYDVLVNNPRFVGAEVLAVDVTAPDDFGTVQWSIRARRVSAFGQIKPRNGVKATMAYTPVVPAEDTLYTAGVSIRRLNGKSLDEVEALVGAGGSKIFGSGVASGKVELACQTLSASEVAQVLPEHPKAWVDGRPQFSEKLDYEGFYKPLVAKLEERRERVEVKVCAVTKEQYLSYRTKYGVKEKYAGPEQVTVKLGDNSFGEPDMLTFRTDGQLFEFWFETTGIVVKEVWKIESTSICQNAGRSRFMLEVATYQYAAGLPHTARMITRGGDSTVRRTEKTLNLLAYKPTPEQHAKTAWAFSTPEASANNTEKLQWLAQTPVALWPDNVYLAMATAHGSVFAVNAETMVGFAETEAAHMVRTAQSIAAFAAKGDLAQAKSLATGLYAGMSSVTGSEGFFKNLNRGMACCVGKRMGVLVPGGGRKYYINPDSEHARALAQDFGCSVDELQGKLALGNRAPMSTAVPCEIELASWIPPDMIGVSMEVASEDEGDHDGDNEYLGAVTCRKAERELRAYDAKEAKKQIHRKSVTKDEHWLEANAWAAKPWAATSKMKLVDVIETCIRSQTHQIRMMPTDGNRSDIGMYMAAMGLADPLLAAGFKFFVFEAQLAGYDPDWYAWHEAFMNGGTSEDILAQMAQELGLTEEMAWFWIWVADLHRRGKRYNRFTKSEDGYCYVKADSLQDAHVILAAAFKAMAQGKQRPADAFSLFPNLGRIILQSDNGKVDLYQELSRLAELGMPAAIRAKQCLDVIQPIVQRLARQLRAEDETEDND